MIKKGVKIQGLTNEILLGMLIAERIWANHGKKIVFTEILPTKKHRISSAHNTGRAVDLRTYYFKDQEEKEQIAQELRDDLGENFDVVLHETHIHLEFDPK